MLVLDEADEMLNKGFKEQIYDVYRYLPPATQVIKEVYQTYIIYMTFTTGGSLLYVANNKPSECSHIY